MNESWKFRQVLVKAMMDRDDIKFLPSEVQVLKRKIAVLEKRIADMEREFELLKGQNEKLRRELKQAYKEQTN